MIKIGNWLDRCDEEGLRTCEGYNSFRAMYLEDGAYEGWEDVVMAYDLKEVIEFKFNTIRHIVVLECHDGSINQVLSLENEDETFRIFSDGRCGGIFNTDGAAFIQYQKGGEQQAVFMIDNSPYDIGDDDEEWYELTYGRDYEMNFTREVGLHELRQHMVNNGVDISINQVTSENTVFVTQL